METVKIRKTEYGIWFDLPFILRTIHRWLLPVFTLAIAMGVTTYILADYTRYDTYTASAISTVVARDSSPNAMSDGAIGGAVIRSVNMWNSNTLQKAIRKAYPERRSNARLYATTVNESGLIRITTTAYSAEDAFYLLNAAIQTYAQVENNFDTNYYSVVLTDVTNDCISKNEVHTYLYGIFGFGAVLFLGFGLLILWTLITDIIHGEAQAENLLEVPVLESLVREKKEKGEKAVFLTHGNLSLDYLESLDKLTSRVERYMSDHHKKILMITSVRENEGKTTVTANLALNMAKRDKKVLLVDLDLRKPSVYKIFDEPVREASSCSDAILSQRGFMNYIDHREDYWGLDILWQFEFVKESDHLLESDELAEELKSLRDQYDLIIIDTPPIGPVRDSDVVAQLADVSMLVVRQDFNRSSVENDVTDQLEEFKAPCMGVVLNYCSGNKKRFHKGGKYRNTGRKGASD